MKKNMSLILNVLIVISSGLGIYLTLFRTSEFMNINGYLYYTIQSNIAILLVALVFLFFNIFKKKIPEFLNIINFITTVGISITFLVFTFMLIPQMFDGYNKYLLSLSNLTVHFISPILAVINFTMYTKIKQNKNTYLYGVIMPLIYFAFIMILTFIIKEPLFASFNGMNRFPYFFMDYETNGWFRVNNGVDELGLFYWLVIIALVTLLISKKYLMFNDKRINKIEM